MNLKIVYIAGKITDAGDQATITEKFDKAEKIWRDKGFIVLNPLKIVNDWHCTWERAMRTCVGAMMLANECYFLPDWQDSRGAKIEHQLAVDLGIPITYE